MFVQLGFRIFLYICCDVNLESLIAKYIRTLWRSRHIAEHVKSVSKLSFNLSLFDFILFIIVVYGNSNWYQSLVLRWLRLAHLRNLT
jgi:hypothetical protein